MKKYKLSDALTPKTLRILQDQSVEHRMIESINMRLLHYITPNINYESMTLFEFIILKALPCLHKPDSIVSENKMYKEYIKVLAKNMMLIFNYRVTIKSKNNTSFWDCLSGGLGDQVNENQKVEIEHCPIDDDISMDTMKDIQLMLIGQLVTRTELSCWGVPLIGQTCTYKLEELNSHE